MPIIKIDDRLNKSEEISELLLALTEESRTSFPKLGLQQIIAAKVRPGLDDSSTAENIISRFPEIGIPNGVLENGSPNVMEEFVKVMVEEIFNSIKNESRTDIAVDSGMIVTSVGASAVGPVTSTGANPAPHTATGVTV